MKPEAGAKPKAIGVVFKDENGRRHEATIKNGAGEVILSSGAIGSPQLLLLSGIGPRKDLEKMKIPLILDNQYVGKGMSDNPMNTIFIPTKKPVRQSLIQTVGITKMGTFIEASSGFGQSSDSIRCHHGIMSGEVQFQLTFTNHGLKIGVLIYLFFSANLHRLGSSPPSPRSSEP